MKRSRTGGARGIATAIVLALAGLLLAGLCVRATAGEMVAENTSPFARFVPDDPDTVLSGAVVALVRHFGRPGEATLRAVRQAATEAPLDARPYLVLGHQQLLDREPERALRTLEAGQRLDPRQPLIHVLLLDRYLRTGRYADAAGQMSVLARTEGATGAPIANAFAAMALAPQTRVAVRRTLDNDPMLEKAVLTALARANVPPATVFALASASARADAGEADGWGPALVARLVGNHQYAAARAVWQRIYALPAGAIAAPVFNAGFRPSPAGPPFNWTLVAGGVGAADMRSGGLALDYYGRDDGELASQLLVLPAGAWRFDFIVDPGKADTSSHLAWTLTCVGQDQPLMTAPITPGASPHRMTTDVVVPAGCPAQRLAVHAGSGDVPTPLSITVRSPQFERRTGPAPAASDTPS